MYEMRRRKLKLTLLPIQGIPHHMGMVCEELAFDVCFWLLVVVVLCHSKSVSVMSWQWYDAWEEEDKALTNLVTDSGDLSLPTQYRFALTGTGILWSCDLCTVDCHTATYCVYGGYVPLYSCLCILREWYRSPNCDNGGTTNTH